MNLTSTTPVQHDGQEKMSNRRTPCPDPCFLPCLQSALHGSVSGDLQLLAKEVSIMQHDAERVLSSDFQQVHPPIFEPGLTHDVNSVGGIEVSPLDSCFPVQSVKRLSLSSSHRRATDDHGLSSTGSGYYTNDTDLAFPRLPRLGFYTPVTLHPRTADSKFARLNGAAGDSCGLYKPH